MKKFLILIFFFINISLFVLSFFFFLISAKQNQTWPFNYTLGEYLPNFIKYYGNKITETEDRDIVLSHYYKLKTDYYLIPSTNAIGLGGSVNVVNENSALVTLNNGELIIFDLKKKNFYKKNTDIVGNYLSVRDVTLDKQNNLLLLSGVIENERSCKSLALDTYKFIIDKNEIQISEKQRVWASEYNCNFWDGFEPTLGSRVILKDNKYYLSVGMFAEGNGINKYPQSKNSSFGKIIEIDRVGNSKIFSSGHRNPQGLFYSAERGLIISTEHGPSGGDEINLIQKNKNYGWPCKTWGNLYSYSKNNNLIDMWPVEFEGFSCTQMNSFTDPLYTWTPSIAVSQGLEYKGDYFEKFKNNLLIGSLGSMSLFRAHLSDENKIINIEKIVLEERIRDLDEAQDGKILIYTDSGNLIILSKQN